MMEVQNVVSESLSRLSLKAAGVLTQAFTTENLIELPVVLGKRDKQKKIAGYIRTSPVQNEEQWSKGVHEGLSRMQMIYKDHKSRVNTVFYLTLLCSFAAIVLLFWIIFTHDRADKSIRFVMPLIPSFLSGTLFWIYRLEGKKLAIIEKDIQEMEKLEYKLQLLPLVNDREKAVQILNSVK